jgi:hypothetical protein
MTVRRLLLILLVLPALCTLLLGVMWEGLKYTWLALKIELRKFRKTIRNIWNTK